MKSIQTAFNYKVTSHVKLFFDHEARGTDLMGDPPDFEIKSFAELDVADHIALHELLRKDHNYKAYQTWDIHEGIVNGVLLKSGIENKTGITYFGTIRNAEDMQVMEPSELGKPKGERKTRPYIEVFPETKGRSFVKTADHHQDKLDHTSRVFDRETGICLWPKHPSATPGYKIA